MKNRKWQRIIAFAASAAMVLSMNGVQMMLTETGGSVHAEELDDSIILDEEWPAGTAADQTASEGEEVVAQEIDAWSSLEEPEIVVEGIEISSGEEADRATGMSSTTAAEATEKMLVDVRLTEEAAEKKGSREQGEVQWMHIFAADRSGAASGSATVRIYLTDRVTGKPAEDAEVLLFTKWQEELPQTVILPPVVLKNALNKNQELSVARIREYEKNEDGSDKKDEQGRKVAAYDYLEFELPAGGCAEFAAALLYRTSEPEYEYRVTARANAVQATASGSELVLYQDYPDEENDNELTAVWEPQASGNETAGAGNGGAGSETAGEIETESESEESTEAGTEEKSEVSGEAGSDTEGEESSAAGSETEGETETAPESEETESEINGEAGNKTDSEGSSESESEAESETNPAQLPENLPVSSIRVTMTKELEETDAPEEIQEAEILPEASGDAAAGDIPADEGSEDITAEAAGAAESNAGQTTEDSSEEESADGADQQTDNTEQTENTDGPAVSGQTYIVHVQAADLQPDAKYDSTVFIHLTDLATGLPASDVATAVCQMKESIAETDPAAVNILYGAVQTPDGRENLTVTRVQETGSAEDGPETVTEEYLKFDLPAGGSTDFYLGFTYATEEEAYEKQLMIDVKAVQYIPVQDLESTAQSEQQNAPENTADAIPDISLEAPENAAGDIAVDAAMNNIVEEELFEDVSAGAADTDQELLSAAELSANDERSIKTQSADEEEAIRAGGAENESTEQTDDATAAGAAELSDNATAAGDTELLNNAAADNTGISESTAAADDTGRLENVAGAGNTGFSDDAVGSVVDAAGNSNADESGGSIDAAVAVEADEAQGAASTQMIAVNVLEEQTQPVTMLWSARNAAVNATVYFAVPEGWLTSSYTVRANVQYGGEGAGVSEWGQIQMADTGQRYTVFSGENLCVFVAEINCKYGGLNTLQFQKVTNGAVQDTKGAFEGSWKTSDFFNGKLYDYTNKQWVNYSPFDPNDHTAFAGKKMYFENRGTKTLSDDIKAVFYEKKAEEPLASLKKVEESSMTKQGERYYVDIPKQECSYVQFVDAGGTVLGDAYSNFYGQGENEEGVESFIFDESSLYSYHYKTNADDSTWGALGGSKIYYDATFSKLIIPDSNGGKNSIPAAGDNSKVYYYAWSTADSSKYVKGEMTKEKEHTSGGNTWRDVWSADLPAECNKIIFSDVSLNKHDSWNANIFGRKTKDLDIPEPSKYAEPCFYADSGDVAAYDGGNGRGGYWDEVYTIRNPEKEGGGSDSVVDIAGGTFKQQDDVLYVNSSFYDYYTDYELNGNNKDSYDQSVGLGSQRGWVPFRQFNQALSEYYKSANESNPLYTGHFQPDYSGWGIRFSEIAASLNLYGYTDYSRFFANNNSTLDINGNYPRYDYVSQGLVSSSLSGENLLLKSGVLSPYFNQSFLEGNNSKNAKIGKVYNNVPFPFKKEEINGVDYWVFDSSRTTLQLKNDAAQGYFLEMIEYDQKYDTGSMVGNADSSGNKKSTDYNWNGSNYTTARGFFPFNMNDQSSNARRLNYGFGTKLSFTFRLTDDGTVLDKNGKAVPIEFKFSGDDDVWVFIDGQLALDVGGDHGRSTGTLDFQSMKWKVNAVKASGGSSSTANSGNFSIQGKNSDEHTLTMFYMERGMWESNMLVTFNFPDDNELQIEKQVDESAVNQDLFAGLFDDASIFQFKIQNQATHYGSKEVELDASSARPVPFTGSAAASSSKNIFKIETGGGRSGVYHWLALTNDTGHNWIDRRLGIITGSADASGAKKYLSFDFYYDYSDNPSLSHMYLQLVDGNGNTLSGYLSGKLYGNSVLRPRQWNTIRVDLEKFAGYGSFDFGSVTQIRFNYDYQRDIYLDGFTFQPQVISPSQIGFVVQQDQIPDYGSAVSGKLENAENALYAVNSKGASEYYRVDENGSFALANGQVATFRDQFRRGSYIYLNEEVNQEVFDTTWKLLENGKTVSTAAFGNTVVNTGKIAAGTAVSDGRKEVWTEAGSNSGYRQTGFAYRADGTETNETIVFRSYANPDSQSVLTKLKALYVNRVKTGSLSVKKEKAYETENLNGTYTFRITFMNVAGMALESAPITREFELTLPGSAEKVFDGIPVGTEYVIEEISSTDGSTLDHIEVEGAVQSGDEKTVKGVIASEGSNICYTFKNTKKPVVNVEVKKFWRGQDNQELTEGLPASIYVQLQHYNELTGGWESYNGNADSYVTLTNLYTGNWKHTFTNLDKYPDYTASQNNPWVYRVVEVSVTDGKVTPVEEGGILDGFKVTYGTTSPAEGDSDTTQIWKTNITNTQVPDKTKIQITKVNASATDQKLEGVEFKLEKLDDNGNPIAEFGTAGAMTGSTDAQGLLTFEDLENGTYRLTETKAHAGFSLLKAPIMITIDRAGKSTVDGGDAVLEDDIIKLTVQNRPKFQIPATGSWSRYIISFSGVILAGAAIIMYLLQKRRKEGKTS